MKRSLFRALALALGLATTSAAAQDARFDVQLFRPSGAPQDLVMVGQSRPLANLSASGGFFFNFSLDPLVLVNKKEGGSSNKILSIIGSRLQLDAIASVGLFDWAEVGVDMDDVSARLEREGVDAFVKSFDELIDALDTKAQELRAG